MAAANRVDCFAPLGRAASICIVALAASCGGGDTPTLNTKSATSVAPASIIVPATGTQAPRVAAQTAQRMRPLMALAPVSVAPAIAAGAYHSMALKSDGTVWTWGWSYGALDITSDASRYVPTQVVGPGGIGALTGVAAIAASGLHSVALKSDGTVWAWGNDVSSQPVDNVLAPVQVVGPGGIGTLTDMTAVAAGGYHSMAIKSDGTVWTWGWNSYGQLGNNGAVMRYPPVQVVGPGGVGALSDVVAIKAGYFHSMALKSDGTVWAWGNGFDGQLGNNRSNVNSGSPVPTQVMGPGGTGALTGVIAIASGAFHSIALKNDGTVWAWGMNISGQLGNNSTTNSSTPVQVLGLGGTGLLAGVSAIQSGTYHSLALRVDGTVLAWGFNALGSLGNCSTIDSSVPALVVGPNCQGLLSSVTAITGGAHQSLAFKSDGTVWAWGWDSYGQLGNPLQIGMTQSSSPVQVVGAGGVGFLNLGASPPPPAPSVQEVQLRPAIQALESIPSNSTVPTPTKRYAVVLTHGWNSNADEWPKAMAAKIRAIIDSRQEQRIIDPNVIWDVYYVDWRDAAGYGCSRVGCGTPWAAYVNARPLGIALGRYLLAKPYDNIHFVGHSAGSNLIEAAAVEVRLQAVRAHLTQPTIHSTFLDAYDPSGASATYGFAANWAEQFVDKRDNLLAVVGLGALENTNLTLPGAYNFVIDTLDEPLVTNNSTCVDIICAHQWPYKWYGITVDAPGSWLYGFPLAIEYRGGNLPDHQSTLHRGDECALLSVSSLCTSSSLPTFAAADLVLPLNPWSSTNGVAASQSSTGTVSISNSTQGLVLSFTTGSPVWLSLASNVSQSFNTLKFDYKFTSTAQGLLSVFIDDQVVFKADELQAQAGVNSSGHVSVGNVTPGPHTLSFRLDRFTDSQSSVVISNITPLIASVIRVVNQKPIAIANGIIVARLGSSIGLDGSGSYDPDQKPLLLTFNWSQTSGPPTLLFDSATARAKFTPSAKGTYVFTLLVNDGQSNSDPATVNVSVPNLGDIDRDGDIDSDDLARINAALNTAASGPNDLRDLDGDGKITALDARKLVTLCTRPRCATH